MAPLPPAERLRQVRSFNDLFTYLRDELHWPLEGKDVEEVTFDWTAEDLGIDAANAVSIQDIKQLRPMGDKQPWGIFFVRFEPRRLPVVAMRRILNGLVFKRRTSAAKATRPAWHRSDLLFISAHGEDQDRHLTFAHFGDPAPDHATDLPTLRVLGWDGDDTRLRLDHVAEALHARLQWPEDAADTEGWRKNWAEAFVLRPRQAITTSKDLAIRLAELARDIRDRARQVLAIESRRGPLRKLHEAFRKTLIHDLSEADFTDTYAQTITYGLFSAAVARTGLTGAQGVCKDALVAEVPSTNPFLREMLSAFLKAGGKRDRIDFDELGVHEVMDLLNSPHTHLDDVLRDFGNRGRGEDPVIHFYEHFLAAYDKKKKVERGVFYTPQPVVSYIVRSVHELLHTEFGLEDGLASTVTWGEMAASHPEIKIPEGVAPDEHFVQILDPATGTATFLVEVIDVIHRTMQSRWEREAGKPLSAAAVAAKWNDYVPQHLLPRVFGYELMMAPYAIAHMKIGLKLKETGYRFESEERARIYLTNALEPASDTQVELDFVPALAHEAAAVNDVKRHKRFTVVIGNPPYAINSQNTDTPITEKVRDYYQVDGIPLGERNPKGLLNDYVKFIRLSETLLFETGSGVLGFITDHSYVDSITFPGMRRHLMKCFSHMWLLDVHGDQKRRECCPDGSEDKNVFDILEGVSILSCVRRIHRGADASVFRHDIWGLRETPDGKGKYDWLRRTSWFDTPWASIRPLPPQFSFIKQEETAPEEYRDFKPINELFLVASNGIKTHRDNLAIAFTKNELESRIATLQDVGQTDGQLSHLYRVSDTDDWSLTAARKELRRDRRWADNLVPCLYRPLDVQYCLHAQVLMDRPRLDSLIHVRHPNLCIATGRQGQVIGDEEWNLVTIGRFVADTNLFRRGGIQYLPAYQYPGTDAAFDRVSCTDRIPNFDKKLISAVASSLQMDFVVDGRGDLGTSFGPEDFVDYVYAILHSPGYRRRYAQYLKTDYARLPLTCPPRLFDELATLGGELVALHLFESPKVAEFITSYAGPDGPLVEKVSFANNTVWLDKAQSRGFSGVPLEVWNFHVGGYQVCEKWLKDRKGRTLSADDLAHYQKVVVALHETIRLMKQIDEVIEAHGGWPGAFVTKDAARAPESAAEPPAPAVVRPERAFRLISLDDERARRLAFKQTLPVYDLAAAAGAFGDGQAVETSGWLEPGRDRLLKEGMFVAQVKGKSMEPTIPNGSWCLFGPPPADPDKRIVLVQLRSTADPETGGAFTVKKLRRETETAPLGFDRTVRVVLESLNPFVAPIVLEDSPDRDLRVVGEWLEVLDAAPEDRLV